MFGGPPWRGDPRRTPETPRRPHENWHGDPAETPGDPAETPAETTAETPAETPTEPPRSLLWSLHLCLQGIAMPPISMPPAHPDMMLCSFLADIQYSMSIMA